MTHVIEVPFHIGDWLSGTMHMDGTEVGAYFMLCMAHYQAGEQGLPDDDVKLARIGKVSLKVWNKIRPTIAEKFIIEDGFWRSPKVIEVLQKIATRSTKARSSVAARWNSKGNSGSFSTQVDERSEEKSRNADENSNPLINKDSDNTNVSNSYNERNTNQKPITNISDTNVSDNNTRPASPRKTSPPVERPDDVQPDVWDDFLRLRKQKRAVVTQTALDGLRREAGKAGYSLNDALSECCARGWTGFKAEWVENNQKGAGHAKTGQFGRNDGFKGAGNPRGKHERARNILLGDPGVTVVEG